MKPIQKFFFWFWLYTFVHSLRGFTFHNNKQNEWKAILILYKKKAHSICFRLLPPTSTITLRLAMQIFCLSFGRSIHCTAGRNGATSGWPVDWWSDGVFPCFCSNTWLEAMLSWQLNCPRPRHPSGHSKNPWLCCKWSDLVERIREHPKMIQPFSLLHRDRTRTDLRRPHGFDWAERAVKEVSVSWMNWVRNAFELPSSIWRNGPSTCLFSLLCSWHWYAHSVAEQHPRMIPPMLDALPHLPSC